MNGLKEITTLLIDLDDTIFDFGRAEAIAVSDAFKEAGVEPTDHLLSEYTRINRAIWKELERGEITREKLLVERFRRLYDELSIDKDPEVVARLYPENLAKGFFWLPGAREAIIDLSKKYDIYVASNGTTWIQKSRIAQSDLEEFVKGVFISQEMGADKPSPLYFDACLAKIGVERSRCCMVGDSLSSDILGGKNAGLKTVWVNTNGLPSDPSIVPDHTVRSLTELKDLLD
ncbi:MAG: YjjG family noncanonical pyrimidine nucleotidase [Lachnospiraceae bacterium]|nr:YjjG family noncanonical pyrimidine nucleotidase [Lachnospiraceae bacterium]